MGNINSYVISVCFAAIFASAVQILSPSKKFGGIISLMLGIFILYTLLSPLKRLIRAPTDGLADFGISEYWEAETKKDFDSAVKSAAERALTIEIKNKIRSVTDAPVEVRVEMGENTAVRLYGVPPEKKGEVADCIRENFGIEPVE